MASGDEGMGASLAVVASRCAADLAPSPGPKCRNSGSVAAPSAPAIAPKLPRSSAGGVRASAVAAASGGASRAINSSSRPAGRSPSMTTSGTSSSARAVSSGSTSAATQSSSHSSTARAALRRVETGRRLAAAAAEVPAQRGDGGAAEQDLAPVARLRRGGQARGGDRHHADIAGVARAAAHALAAQHHAAADRRADEDIAGNRRQRGRGRGTVRRWRRRCRRSPPTTGRPQARSSSAPKSNVVPGGESLARQVELRRASCRDYRAAPRRCRRCGAGARPGPGAPDPRRPRAPAPAPRPAAAACWSCVRCASTAPDRSASAVSIRARSSRTPIA